MRKRLLFFILLAVLVILSVLFWRRPAHSPDYTERPQAPVQSNNALPQTTTAMSQAASPTIGKPATNLPLANNIRTPDGFKQYIEDHNKPVDFYGLVIDQDSNALAGAKIKIGIKHWTVGDPINLLAGSRQIDLEQTSDINGRFEFHGTTGDGFGVGITKDGYELEPNRYGFGPSAGNYENPIIFKMWRTDIHEHLISGEKGFDIVPDGRSYYINLTDGTISESGTGDLKVWIQYTNQIVPGQLYDWSAEVEVINGGLLGEPPGTVMYQAPVDGYAPFFQSRQQIKGGQRGRTGEHQFYLRLNNGQEYGHMTIGLYAPFNNDTPGLVHLTYTINPSGSRILR